MKRTIEICRTHKYGSEKHKTPTGLFFTNWKAEETTSTFDDEWDLRWNFNIENKLGVDGINIATGYPASHSCLRLQKKTPNFYMSGLMNGSRFRNS
jgi:hypothetical protein